ncbi:hypothetical protein XH86_05165 [Bradyrhizobium guangdongense]|uniref:Uncharacterized protein n=1 Tax=Bradyrhizobium guangdongense TaxID=1325090 RepID=A0ABX6UA55_9BRAD|nr:hypothetical protein X265_05170 [Bradyrhizobium guangdongense]QOZ58197.1 hypothetical protein XH86_05165 [Bradyrhizobium guangdongense]
MKAVRVTGVFQVTLDVLDNSGTSITSIDALTIGCRHVVTVKNFSTSPKQVSVEVSLLNGTTSLEFLVGGYSASQWTDQTHGTIAGGTEGKLSCYLERTSGPNSLNEPIQLVRLKAGDGPPKPLYTVRSSHIPFADTIDAV